MEFASKAFVLDDTDMILKMLGLIDAALIASLVVMVIISGYENFVSRFDAEDEVHWLGTIDAGSLKIKVASTIVAISSVFTNMEIGIDKYSVADLQSRFNLGKQAVYNRLDALDIKRSEERRVGKEC